MTARPKANGLSRRFSPFAQFRMMRGLKQSDLAAKTSIHETIVSKIERGVRRPTERQAKLLAQALRTTYRKMAELLAETFFWTRGKRSRKSSRA